jgi:hypothetical protein
MPERETKVGRAQANIAIPPETKDLIIVGPKSMIGDEDAISFN